MKKISTIIDDMGGTSFVARRVGVKPSTVSMWKKNNSIPLWWRMSLRDIAKERGLPDPDFSK